MRLVSTGGTTSSNNILYVNYVRYRVQNKVAQRIEARVRSLDEGNENFLALRETFSLLAPRSSNGKIVSKNPCQIRKGCPGYRCLVLSRAFSQFRRFVLSGGFFFSRAASARSFLLGLGLAVSLSLLLRSPAHYISHSEVFLSSSELANTFRIVFLVRLVSRCFSRRLIFLVIVSFFCPSRFIKVSTVAVVCFSMRQP